MDQLFMDSQDEFNLDVRDHSLDSENMMPPIVIGFTVAITVAITVIGTRGGP